MILYLILNVKKLQFLKIYLALEYKIINYYYIINKKTVTIQLKSKTKLLYFYIKCYILFILNYHTKKKKNNKICQQNYVKCLMSGSTI